MRPAHGWCDGQDPVRRDDRETAVANRTALLPVLRGLCFPAVLIEAGDNVMTHPRNRGAPDEAAYAHLAKAIVLHCFRNTFLEDLHAGIHPDSATGDYTDVTVVSPFGEIPWNRLGRISDAEMRSLMRQCVNRVYTYLLHLETSRGFKVDPRWDPPELDPDMMDDLETIKAEETATLR